MRLGYSWNSLFRGLNLLLTDDLVVHLYTMSGETAVAKWIDTKKSKSWA